MHSFNQIYEFFNIVSTNISMQKIDFFKVSAKNYRLFNFRNIISQSLNISKIRFEECDIPQYFRIAKNFQLEFKEIQCTNSYFGVLVFLKDSKNSKLQGVSLFNSSLKIKIVNSLKNVNYYEVNFTNFL